MDNGGSVSFRERYAGFPGELNSKRRLDDEKRDLNEMNCVGVIGLTFMNIIKGAKRYERYNQKTAS
jgi:hypothetical protein